MTPNKALEWISHIQQISADDEAAHGSEDEARQKFLEALAGGSYTDIEQAKEIAKILLESNKIEFARWCA